MTLFRRLTPWMLAALMLVLAAGCDRPSDPASLIAKSQEHREKGEHGAAIVELMNLLQQNPDHAEARYLLGTVYLESGQADFATLELEKALALGYDPKQVLVALAKSLIAKEKFKEALEATDPARVPGAQGSPEILNVRAFAQLALRQLAAAKSSLDLALVLQPDFADGMLSQARIALLQEDTDTAKALVDKALAVAPSNVDAWLLKGSLQHQSGQTDLARTTYQKAIEINPRSAAARHELVALEITAKRYDEAARELDKAREIAPKHVMGKYLRALLETRRGNYAAAQDAVYQALELAPEHVPSTLLAGVIEIGRRRPDEAEKYLQQVLKLSPRNLYGRKLLAASQLQRRQVAQSIATLAPVVDTPAAASDPALLALAGEAYMQDKQFAKATGYFEKAAELDPQNPSTRINLGMSRMAIGETDRAIADLEAAAALGPGGVRADIMLAMMNLRRKEYDKALRTLAKLEKAHPKNLLLFNMKAVAYIGKGDTAQARVQLERALQIDPTYFPAAANLAQLDLQAGNLAAARRRYESVLEKDKNQVQAMLALADLVSRTRGPEQDVLAWIQRAKEASPGANAPYWAEIEHYRRNGQLDKALAIALERKKLYPGDPDALEILGKLLVAKGHTADAVAVYSERAALVPNSAAALLDLATVQMAAKKPADAAATLRNALRLRPGYPEARSLLVAAELAQDRVVWALQIARDVQKDMPKAPLGYVLEGDVLVAGKKYAQAAALYEKAYALRKSGTVAIKLHDAWVSAGKPELGEARLKEWLAERPADLLTRRHLAYGMMQRGKYALAVEQYRLVLQRQPKDAVVLNNIAWGLSKLKDPTALTYAQQAHEISPGDAAIADTLAQILIEKGDLTRGVEILHKAVASAPANSEIRYHLAEALAKSGDKAKAINQLQIAIGSGSKFPQQAEAVALLKQLSQK